MILFRTVFGNAFSLGLLIINVLDGELVEHLYNVSEVDPNPWAETLG